jgi:hypothetical protein
MPMPIHVVDLHILLTTNVAHRNPDQVQTYKTPTQDYHPATATTRFPLTRQASRFRVAGHTTNCDVPSLIDCGSNGTWTWTALEIDGSTVSL